MSKKISNTIILVLPIIFILILMYIFKTDVLLYEKIGIEDGILEWFQFGLYIISSFLSFAIFINLKDNGGFIRVLYILLGLVLLLISLEEISWGERVFDGLSREIIPEVILENNVQNETNIHNVEVIHNKIGYVYLLICFYGCFSWLIYLIIGKLIALNNRVKEFVKYTSPSYWYILYFLPLSINLFGLFYTFKSQTYEVAETFLALGVFMFLLNIYIDTKKDRYLKVS